ncbi:DNA polymerase III subunit chi [Salipiger marinus]|jgi:DNA polymerase III subunit chi|uniref:DNA polymerase III, chi subunit n=1 Tax=Salipiger marinus TaxID=555512 RepID=A0A1G8SVI9_9RHOB|nr:MULTISPECIES: DNA polymerase III subunit chi [Salipiger]HBM58164.1 DNA polymerase III subunit chi [Citreicella sp.]MCD1620556.1 DNA polymerase III subunit chi [Salipiger manganoxidans]MEB3420468.1 DNA polymerase III subunit chi [Salipiger manganoxidans]SDJ32590.1 DNA polymerase III, chi subunit [Salipiger marinus]HBT00626.1 DNA polymerase III subunit chi [Citreicella sp.]|tara:strand:+ start:51 stop:509 length:459 start_codon:yes stop_codon:yes gene_type:complete
MGVAMFYHLTQRPLEATLPMLLDRALAAGWRVVVRGTDPARLDWLDEKLWLGPEDGFLPHGRAGGPHDALQPVLLTERGDLPNDPACLMAVDGAAVSAEEAGRMERTCILFDGNDTQALQAARGLWRSLTAAGCAAQYWSEESGSWKKKAES